MLFTTDQIPTYVVGIGDLLPSGDMNAYANAGGVPKPGMPGDDKYYKAFDQGDLLDAFEQIVFDVIPCSFVIDEAPFFEDEVEVQLDGMTIPQIDIADCGSGSGWAWSQNGPTWEMTLCGSACIDYKNSKVLDPDVQNLGVTYFCFPG
jgi:hypothetical protein